MIVSNLIQVREFLCHHSRNPHFSGVSEFCKSRLRTLLIKKLPSILIEKSVAGHANPFGMSADYQRRYCKMKISETKNGVGIFIYNLTALV